MNRIFYHRMVLVIFLPLLFISARLQAQLVNEDRIPNWYNSNVWLNGLKLQPHKTINTVEFEKQYKAHKLWWDKAFKYLKETNFADIKPGNYPIDGENVFAKVTESPLRDKSKKGGWESHPDYADIHYVLNGKENIGLVTIPIGYDVRKDSLQYSEKARFYTADTGVFFIIFSQDAHRPHLKVDGYDVVKKLVIKVRTTDN